MIRVIDKNNCCGCSACMQKCPKQCISMITDVEGFWYPTVEESDCIHCGLCKKVCPMLHAVKSVPPRKVISAFNKNEDTRKNSSSGGIFTILAEKTISNGGIVFGAKFNEKWDVVLDSTDNYSGIRAFNGSKYVQADVGGSFKKCEQFLNDRRQVLFSGTPCQIVGLQQYLGKHYDNLITVDILCHGVPSPMLWQEYIKCYTDTHFIQKINFREKSKGWKNYRFVITATNGRTILNESHKDNIYMQTFLTDLIVRPSCFTCPFRGMDYRQADISIGDYWGVEQLQPEMYDNKGTCIVTLNTDKALRFMDKFDIKWKDTDLYRAAIYNGALQRFINSNPRRNHFFSSIRSSHQLLKQMHIHLLPDDQYYKFVTPLYVRIKNSIEYKIYKFFSKIFYR